MWQKAKKDDPERAARKFIWRLGTEKLTRHTPCRQRVLIVGDPYTRLIASKHITEKLSAINGESVGIGLLYSTVP
jgi:hypothetical protein